MLLCFLLISPNLMPPELGVIAAKTNRPYHISLSWISETSANKVYVASNYPWFDRALLAGSNSVTVSNLYPPTVYSFSVTSMNAHGDESDFSPVFVFPYPQTNFANLFIGNMTQPALVETNASGIKFYRGLISASASSLSYTLQWSANLKAWNSVPGIFMVTNSPANWRLRLLVTNNLNGIAKPD